MLFPPLSPSSKQVNMHNLARRRHDMLIEHWRRRYITMQIGHHGRLANDISVGRNLSSCTSTNEVTNRARYSGEKTKELEHINHIIFELFVY